ncbi:protein POLLENLESS 3-LIKE 1-like isoform X2 [Magnolia sinica]|uniref:protein POLLENLESS 3-LIKE 1-like isoform X2 n=1 Tax=Magnolia sinica TaxID=86752 RepID=UPI002657D580|nr:protein POLLENLESS 3-LIKE 1-like isoform X2 [Magnolia sinica]
MFFYAASRYMALFVVSLVCYVETFSFSGLLFHWFTLSGHDCGLNTFIVMTLILVFIFAIVALHPAVGLLKSKFGFDDAFNYKEEHDLAVALKRKALCIEPDKNKQCNLAICLMQTGRISEAKSLLERIQPSSSDSDKHGPDSYMKSFKHACEMLAGLKCQLMNGAIGTKIQRSSASSITGILNSPGSGEAKKNCGLQVQKELTEAEMHDRAVDICKWVTSSHSVGPHKGEKSMVCPQHVLFDDVAP